MTAAIVCGIDLGKAKRFACPCCGKESDDLEDFATSFCWDCAEDNFNCARCVKSGLEIARASSARGRYHRFACWAQSGNIAVALCGLKVAGGDIGQDAGWRKECGHCWPEPAGEAAS